MSIKLFCQIHLPYTIRLKDKTMYKFIIPDCDNFKDFLVKFIPDEDDFSNDTNMCSVLEIIVIVNKYNYQDYEKYGDDIASVYHLPNEDMVDIFKLLTVRLNHLLKYIRYSTKMFWVDELSINPISGIVGTGTEYSFLHPFYKSTQNIRSVYQYYDNYMVDLEYKDLEPLSDSSLNDYSDKTIIDSVWTDYYFKAYQAIYESKYDNFILFLAISAESFIKRAIDSYSYENDVVLKKLVEVGVNKTVETYYNIILKYLTGKSLLDIDQSLYKNIFTIYKLRNSIMHKGFLDTDSYQKVGIKQLDHRTCLTMINKLNSTFSIVNKLLNSKTILTNDRVNIEK